MDALEKLAQDLGLSLGALCELLALGRATRDGGMIAAVERSAGKAADWVVVTLTSGAAYHIMLEKQR